MTLVKELAGCEQDTQIHHKHDKLEDLEEYWVVVELDLNPNFVLDAWLGFALSFGFNETVVDAW